MSLPDKITEKRAKVVQPNKQASKPATTAAKDHKQDREFGRGIQHQEQNTSKHQNQPTAAVPKSGWPIATVRVRNCVSLE